MALGSLSRLLRRDRTDSEGPSDELEPVAAPDLDAVGEAYRSAHGQLAAGKLSEAESTLRASLERWPDQPDLLHLLGVVLAQQGRLDTAGETLRRVRDLTPDAPDPAIDHGNVLRLAGDAPGALDAYRSAQRLAPADPRPAFALGDLLFELGRLDEVIATLSSALRLDPGATAPRFQHGTALAMRGRLDEAIATLRELVQIAPELAPAHANLGRALQEARRLEEARAALERAVELQPDLVDAHNNLGSLLNAQGLSSEGEACYRRALEIEPDNVMAHSNLCLSLNYRDDVSPAETFAEHRRFGQRHRAEAPAPRAAARDRSDPLRVGYLSADFRRHSVAHFIEPILAGHRPERVTTFCYSDVARPDPITERLRGTAAHWRDVSALDAAGALELMRADRLDLLVELGGHTAGPRLAMLGARAAPVQATYLGYPNTTGIEAIDYRLTDAIADPPGLTEQWHTERLVRLPRSFLLYQPPAEAPEPAAGGEPGAITFGSFNNLNKVSPSCLALWAAVLAALPGSRLVLKTRQLSDQGTRSRWLSVLGAAGIAPERVELRGYLLDPGEHLVAYNAIDVGLDTYPYHGTTTTCEALWMGVPVLSLVGEVHAARVGVSLLAQVGLGDLAAPDTDALVAAALALAGDAERRHTLRRELRETMRRSPLCDAGAFIADLEAAYRSMVEGTVTQAAPA